MSELYRLFVCSLNMMAMRGFCVETYREFIDAYNIIRDHQKNGLDCDELLNEYTDASVSRKIREIMSGSFRYTRDTKSVRDNYTYAVTNYTTGDTCLVFFSNGKSDNFLSDDLKKIVNCLEKFSKTLTGDNDFCRPHSGIKGLICLRGKIGSNPREKTNKIQNLDIIGERIVLSCIYDNMMQSQHSMMSNEETEEFLNESIISGSKIPSVAKNKDIFHMYLGSEIGCIDRIHQYKISNEEMLDMSIFYRRVK